MSFENGMDLEALCKWWDDADTLEACFSWKGADYWDKEGKRLALVQSHITLDVPHLRRRK